MPRRCKTHHPRLDCEPTTITISPAAGRCSTKRLERPFRLCRFSGRGQGGDIAVRGSSPWLCRRSCCSGLSGSRPVEVIAARWPICFPKPPSMTNSIRRQASPASRGSPRNHRRRGPRSTVLVGKQPSRIGGPGRKSVRASLRMALPLSTNPNPRPMFFLSAGSDRHKMKSSAIQSDAAISAPSPMRMARSIVSSPSTLP